MDYAAFGSRNGEQRPHCLSRVLKYTADYAALGSRSGIIFYADHQRVQFDDSGRIEVALLGPEKKFEMTGHLIYDP